MNGAERIEGGRVYGSAGDGVRWQHRSDRPSHHPDNCQGSCCWRKVDAGRPQGGDTDGTA